MAGKDVLSAPPAQDLLCVFEALREPVETSRAQGRFLNPWDFAGLKRDEGRISGALAGLCKEEFGGDVSRKFLTIYLSRAISAVPWVEEINSGYRICTEVNLLDERKDRIDLVIETEHHLVGIEVKVDAQLGDRQLERYLEALGFWADCTRREAHLVFLAPSRAPLESVHSTSWRDVAAAADAAAGFPEQKRSFIEQYIARFGDYVRDL